jgi:uncharacterized protein YbcV (DUF1398 family)
MKVIAYWLFVSLSLFSLLGHAQVSSQKESLITKTISIDDFDSLDIQGPVNIYIDATQTHSSLQIMGDQKRVFAVTYSEKNHILHLGTKHIYQSKPGESLTIRVNTSSPAQIKQIRFDSDASLFGKGLSGSLSLHAQGAGQVNLYTNKLNLKSLYSSGNESIIFHNILSSNLEIEAHNSHNVVIQGIVSLKQVKCAGDGNLMVYWVNSPYLSIDAHGKGKISLAGVVKTLDIQLSQDTRLFAQQLRAHQGFIKTEKRAQATVDVRSTLRAFAKDNSVIYYSSPINFISRYSEGQGLVLNKN